MINKRLETLTKKNSAIREMFEEGNRLAEKYGRENVFDFSLGNPCVETPSIVKDTIIDNLKNLSSITLHGYMPNAGYSSVREAIAASLNAMGDVHYTLNNLVLAVGAAGGLNCVLQTLLNPYDEVIVVAPFFVEYINYIENWGGKTVIAKSDNQTFHLSIPNVEKCITPKTKAIIVNNPNNPTGVVYPEDNLRLLASLLVQKEKEFGHPIYIISDEPYRELVYDGTKVPFIPDIYDDTIIVYSWSKSLSVPGERIGYVAISPNAIDSDLLFRAISISNRIIGFVNAPSLMQHVVNNCLTLKPDLSLYDHNRRILYNELTKIGFDCIYPKGAFYLWVKAPIEEKVFVAKAKELKLLLVGGSAFYGDGFVRIAYCVPEKQVIASIPIFKKLYSLSKD